jgi:hypothetical protein
MQYGQTYYSNTARRLKEVTLGYITPWWGGGPSAHGHLTGMDRQPVAWNAHQQPATHALRSGTPVGPPHSLSDHVLLRGALLAPRAHDLPVVPEAPSWHGQQGWLRQPREFRDTRGAMQGWRARAHMRDLPPALLLPLGFGALRNRKGYSFAVTFRTKLSGVAPVWYQLKKAGGGAAGSCTRQLHSARWWKRRARPRLLLRRFMHARMLACLLPAVPQKGVALPAVQGLIGMRVRCAWSAPRPSLARPLAPATVNSNNEQQRNPVRASYLAGTRISPVRPRLPPMLPLLCSPAGGGQALGAPGEP